MKRLLYILIPALLLLVPDRILAQRTGSFDTTIPFMSASRAASMHVPSSYDPANKYRLMICLHGLGDTCSDYRDALINILRWDANIPNTIFIFPEAANRWTDYYLPAGGEGIIRESIQFAMAQYHIDTSNVVLQGFSLGGRAALRYGLDNDTMFRGLLLNTPALQGVKDALNGSPASYFFNYANASRIPVYVTHGGKDIAYTGPIDSAVEQLMLHDGPVQLNRFPLMDHTLPPVPQMLGFIPFFDTPGHAGADLELVRLRLPRYNCTGTVTPTLFLRNTGRTTISSGALQVRVNNGAPATVSISTALAPFEHALLPLPSQSLSSGANTISVTVSQVGGSADTVVANNAAAGSLDYTATAQALPLDEGFEGTAFPPAGWQLQESGDFYTPWAFDNTVAKTGTNSVNVFNTAYFFDNRGRSDALLSPVIDLRGSITPQLSFDLAYNYHRFTPPYFTTVMDFADTLDVLISTDCGDHFTSLFRKGGADLATFSQPITNPTDAMGSFAVPADSNWKRVTIGLGSYASAPGAVIKFNYISGIGGSLNIDNIRVAAASGVPSGSRQAASVYPNPATDAVTIHPGSEAIARVVILDAAGRMVRSMIHQAADMQPFRMDLRSLPPALYTLQLFTETGVHTTLLSLRH